jgi:hypothetical protein
VLTATAVAVADPSRTATSATRSELDAASSLRGSSMTVAKAPYWTTLRLICIQLGQMTWRVEELGDGRADPHDLDIARTDVKRAWVSAARWTKPCTRPLHVVIRRQCGSGDAYS